MDLCPSVFRPFSIARPWFCMAPLCYSPFVSLCPRASPARRGRFDLVVWHKSPLTFGQTVKKHNVEA
jgi:hypothetical protein